VILPVLLRRFEEGGRPSLLPTSGSEEGGRPSLFKTGCPASFILENPQELVDFQGRWRRDPRGRHLERLAGLFRKFPIVVILGARRHGYDAAMASLDLALLYLKEGRTADVLPLAEEMAALFEARDVHREAVAAVLLFREAAQRDEVTAGMVRELAARLETARRGGQAEGR
jgi:hypothetical protein